MGEHPDRGPAITKLAGSGAGDPPVYVTPAAFDVSVLPEDWDGPDGRYLWTVRAERRGAGRWAVLRLGHCLGRDGEWDYESQPSGREDEWLDAHRFSLEEALDLAREHAPEVSVNGHRAIDALARHRKAGQFEMCFPYGSKAEADRGHGRVARLRVTGTGAGEGELR